MLLTRVKFVSSNCPVSIFYQISELRTFLCNETAAHVSIRWLQNGLQNIICKVLEVVHREGTRFLSGNSESKHRETFREILGRTLDYSQPTISRIFLRSLGHPFLSFVFRECVFRIWIGRSEKKKKEKKCA